jgi:ATP-binding cassette subfamily F protein uup
VAKGTAAERERGTVRIGAEMQRLGSKLLDCAGVSIDAPGGRRIASGFSYEFLRKDRIGIVGPNGAGKTTFLQALQGKLPLAEGAIDAGDTLVWGYYDQRGLEAMDDDTRVLAFVKEAVATAPGAGVSDATDEKAATALLSRFLFPPRRWHERVAKLSGGERRRLQMLAVLASQPNFLLLDEPTNYLDLDTLGVLEQFLVEEYAGVLVVVSHDRYFVDKVADHLFVLTGDGSGRVLDFQGSFTEYLASREPAEWAARKPPPSPASGPPPPPAGKPKARQKDEVQTAGGAEAKPLSRFERQALESHEAEMEALSQQQSDLQAKIDAFDVRARKLR